MDRQSDFTFWVHLSQTNIELIYGKGAFSFTFDGHECPVFLFITRMRSTDESALSRLDQLDLE